MSQPDAARSEAAPNSAPVLEIFASLQGEGLYVGEPQIFLRLAGCSLRCRYCDTPHSWGLPTQSPGPEREFAGWLTPFQVACRIAELETPNQGPAGNLEPGLAAPFSGARSVSLTGGEPLEWVPFARALKPLLGRRRLHLETSGLFPKALAAGLDAFDHISLDLKLASDQRPPKPLAAQPGLPAPSAEPPPLDGRELVSARRASLRLIADRDACAKLVLTERSALDEAHAALADLADLAPGLPLFVQPATPFSGAKPPQALLLGEVLEEALALGLRPRVLPQIHKLLGLP